MVTTPSHNSHDLPERTRQAAGQANNAKAARLDDVGGLTITIKWLRRRRNKTQHAQATRFKENEAPRAVPLRHPPRVPNRHCGDGQPTAERTQGNARK